MNKTGLTAGSILSLVLAVLFFWVFIFSIWFSNNIINRDTFVSKTVSVLESEQVRNAISTELVDRVKERRPIVGAVTAPILSKIIVGILDTDLFDAVYRRMAEELHLQLTTKNPRPLVINVKDTAEFIRPLVERQNPDLIDNLPDQIVVIGQGQVPSLYRIGSILSVLGPVLLIVAIVILALVWRKVVQKRSFFTILGLIIAASGFLFYFIVPAIGSYAVSSAQSANTAIVIDSLFKSFTSPLVRLSLSAFVMGLLIAAVSAFLKRDLFRLPSKK